MMAMNHRSKFSQTKVIQVSLKPEVNCTNSNIFNITCPEYVFTLANSAIIISSACNTGCYRVFLDALYTPVPTKIKLSVINKDGCQNPTPGLINIFALPIIKPSSALSICYFDLDDKENSDKILTETKFLKDKKDLFVTHQKSSNESELVFIVASNLKWYKKNPIMFSRDGYCETIINLCTTIVINTNDWLVKSDFFDACETDHISNPFVWIRKVNYKPPYLYFFLRYNLSESRPHPPSDCTLRLKLFYSYTKTQLCLSLQTPFCQIDPIHGYFINIYFNKPLSLKKDVPTKIIFSETFSNENFVGIFFPKADDNIIPSPCYWLPLKKLKIMLYSKKDVAVTCQDKIGKVFFFSRHYINSTEYFELSGDEIGSNLLGHDFIELMTSAYDINALPTIFISNEIRTHANTSTILKMSWTKMS